MRLDIWFDGSCRPKKITKNKCEKTGPSAVGVVVKKDGLIVYKTSRYVGLLDNNQAEYEALLLSINIALDLGAKDVVFYTDSSLVEKQMNNKYGCFSDLLIPYYMQAKNLMYLLPNFQIKWISRSGNKEADRLCRKELDIFQQQELMKQGSD